MKKPKPGQFCYINNKLFRFAKRTNGCIGCVLNEIWLCPAIVDRRYNNVPFNCAGDGVIIVNV